MINNTIENSVTQQQPTRPESPPFYPQPLTLSEEEEQLEAGWIQPRKIGKKTRNFGKGNGVFKRKSVWTNTSLQMTLMAFLSLLSLCYSNPMIRHHN
jgi:hypothetical protein